MNDLRDLVDRAEALARLAHGDTLNDKNGERYIEHPRRVMMNIPAATATLIGSGRVPMEAAEWIEYFKALAWLHDTVEETWVNLYLLGQVFPRKTFDVDIPNGVWHLSEDAFDHDRRAYLEFIADDWRLLVPKFGDLMDNGDPKRIAQIADSPTRVRLTKKYDDTAKTLGVVDEFNRWRDIRIEEMVSA